MYLTPEKRMNMATFKDTENQYNTVPQLVESVKNTIHNQKIVLETDPLDIPKTEFDSFPAVSVTNFSTLGAAFNHRGEKTCILNFASFTMPGGGVAMGMHAQEESICLVSTLRACLQDKKCKKQYYDYHRTLELPEHNDDIIYSPDVTVFKHPDQLEPKMLKESDWLNVDILSCAAPSLSDHPSNKANPHCGTVPLRISRADLFEMLKKRYKRIFEVAHMEGTETLILGAFGCGVFKNPPELVAEAFKSVISEYGKWFKNIEFAILGSKSSENYTAFAEAFSGADFVNYVEPKMKSPVISTEPEEPEPEKVTLPDYTSQKVTHKIFGSGIIQHFDGTHLTIDFEDAGNKTLDFVFSFSGPMHLINEELDKEAYGIAELAKVRKEWERKR